MLIKHFVLIGILTLLIAACGRDTREVDTPPATSYDSTSLPAGDTLPLGPTDHDCEIAGEVLEDNTFWARREGILLAIVADSTTYDEDYGESHRVLLVYDTDNCQVVDRQELPVNQSPDFPYYLAPIVYNKLNKFVGISGFDQLYVYDTQNRRLLPPARPDFRTERELEDAQSGMIQWLEVWEDYIIGWAEDKGTFVFELSENGAPKAVLPYAEYQKEMTEFESLFLLPSEGDSVQLLIPHYDYSQNSFAINPLLDEPKPIAQAVPKSASNDRYVILRGTDGSDQVYAIDLVDRKRMELPSNVAGQSNAQILEFLRKQ